MKNKKESPQLANHTYATSNRPDTGLLLRPEGYYARSYLGKMQRYHKLYTSCVITARAARDKLYEGMTPKPRLKRGRKKITPEETCISVVPSGVSYRKPWHLKVDGVSLGYYHSLKEVLAAYERATGA